MSIHYIKNNKSGFSLVEVLIACAIISTMIFALMSAVQKGISLSLNALKQTQASFLLEEGAEAIKSIRDANWTNISSITLDTNYYFSYNNSTNLWSVSTTPTTAIDSMFTRTVTLSQVFRNATDDIAVSGTVDTHIKKVVVTVSWPSSDGTTFSRNLSFYLVNIFN